MLNLYISPNCASCKKVKEFFKEYNIAYVEKNIFSTPLHKDDIYKMVINSEGGFDDIISTRSKIIKEQNIDIDKMKTSELVEFIIANPSILKRPIIVDEEEIQVGYNNEDIEVFLPPEIKERKCLECFGKGIECDFVKELKNIK